MYFTAANSRYVELCDFSPSENVPYAMVFEFLHDITAVRMPACVGVNDFGEGMLGFNCVPVDLV